MSRVTKNCTYKKRACPVDVYVGEGDVIVPNSQKRYKQTHLDGYEEPQVLTYSLERQATTINCYIVLKYYIYHLVDNHRIVVRFK